MRAARRVAGSLSAAATASARERTEARSFGHSAEPPMS